MAKKKAPIKVVERNVRAALMMDERYKRRIENPDGEQSREIRLTDPSWKPRWMNGAIQVDRIWRAKRSGWDHVLVTELADKEQVGGFVETPEGFVSRGDKSQEVLMKIPRFVWSQIEDAKTARNNRGMGNSEATKRELVEAAGESLGGEAADYLDQHVGPVGEVTDLVERRERTPEPE